MRVDGQPPELVWISSDGGFDAIIPARFCLMIINLPLHLRVHNLPLIYFGFFPDAGS